MSLILEISDEALREIESIRQHYLGINLELPERFSDCLLKRLDELCRQPLTRPKMLKGIRRANLETFPYALYYEYETGRLHLLLVAHQSRHPQELKRRLS